MAKDSYEKKKKALAAGYKVAHAVGHDAGNRSMKKEGRSKWSEKDWNKAAETFKNVHAEK